MAAFLLLLTVVATACSPAAGGCAAVDGAQSVVAFLIIIGTVLSMLTIRPGDDDAGRP